MTELAKAYGGALYALALEENIETTVKEELALVCGILAENPGYIQLVESRAVPKAERLGLLDEAFSGKVHAYLLSFMKILVERGSFASLKECAEAFENAYNAQHGIVPATATVAEALTPDQQERLVRALEQKTGKKVLLTVKLDPSLRGGMRVEMEGQMYDNSVASRLGHLRRALAN